MSNYTIIDDEKHRLAREEFQRRPRVLFFSTRGNGNRHLYNALCDWGCEVLMTDDPCVPTWPCINFDLFVVDTDRCKSKKDAALVLDHAAVGYIVPTVVFGAPPKKRHVDEPFAYMRHREPDELLEALVWLRDEHPDREHYGEQFRHMKLPAKVAVEAA